MQLLHVNQLDNVHAGACTLYYEAEANATYLPFLDLYLLRLQQNQITGVQFLQLLLQAGLSPAGLIMEVKTICT